jgi:hypothetical protein
MRLEFGLFKARILQEIEHYSRVPYPTSRAKTLKMKESNFFYVSINPKMPLITNNRHCFHSLKY